MSLKQTQQVWQLKLKPGPKFVLLALADYANDQGECYPSLKQLQQKCGLARSTLINHLQWLREAQWILVKHQHDKRGYRRRNLYRLMTGQSPDSGLTKVQNLDGNNINSHINGYKNTRGPKSGPRDDALAKNKSALAGAI